MTFDWSVADKASIVLSIVSTGITATSILYGMLDRHRKSISLSEQRDKLSDSFKQIDELWNEMQEKDEVVRMVINIRNPKFLSAFSRQLERSVHVCLIPRTLLLIYLLIRMRMAKRILEKDISEQLNLKMAGKANPQVPNNLRQRIEDLFCAVQDMYCDKLVCVNYNLEHTLETSSSLVDMIQTTSVELQPDDELQARIWDRIGTCDVKCDDLRSIVLEELERGTGEYDIWLLKILKVNTEFRGLLFDHTDVSDDSRSCEQLSVLLIPSIEGSSSDIAASDWPDKYRRSVEQYELSYLI